MRERSFEIRCVRGRAPTRGLFVSCSPRSFPRASQDGKASLKSSTVDWVECEKCEHWQPLPEGITPEGLPDSFTCRDADWAGAEDGCGSESDESDVDVDAVLAAHPEQKGKGNKKKRMREKKKTKKKKKDETPEEERQRVCEAVDKLSLPNRSAAEKNFDPKKVLKAGGLNEAELGRACDGLGIKKPAGALAKLKSIQARDDPENKARSVKKGVFKEGDFTTYTMGQLATFLKDKGKRTKGDRAQLLEWAQNLDGAPPARLKGGGGPTPDSPMATVATLPGEHHTTQKTPPSVEDQSHKKALALVRRRGGDRRSMHVAANEFAGALGELDFGRGEGDSDSDGDGGGGGGGSVDPPPDSRFELNALKLSNGRPIVMSFDASQFQTRLDCAMGTGGHRVSASSSGEKVSVTISGSMTAADLASDEAITAAFELVYETLKLVRDRRADLQTHSDDSQTTLVTDKMDIVFLHTPAASKRFFKEVPNRKRKQPCDADGGHDDGD